jgi:hypothetical protein
MRASTVLLAACCLLGGCAALPPEGSLARLKHEARTDIVRDCSRYPERYGFSYTLQEYLVAVRDAPGWVPPLTEYCHSLARRSVR